VARNLHEASGRSLDIVNARNGYGRVLISMSWEFFRGDGRAVAKGRSQTPSGNRRLAASGGGKDRLRTTWITRAVAGVVS